LNFVHCLIQIKFFTVLRNTVYVFTYECYRIGEVSKKKFILITHHTHGRCQAQCAWQRPQPTRPTTFHVWKTRGCQCSFRLL